jgi:hypothetical protein
MRAAEDVTIDESTLNTLSNIANEKEYEYEPLEICTVNKMKTFVDIKVLDEQGKIIGNFISHKVQIYAASSKKDLEGENAEVCGYTVASFNSISQKDRMKAALLDGYYKLSFVTSLYHKQPLTFIQEADAHLHDLYEFFPKLFEFLFPKLIAYHAEMNKSVLDTCLASFNISKQTKSRPQEQQVDAVKVNIQGEITSPSRTGASIFGKYNENVSNNGSNFKNGTNILFIA